MSEKPVKTINLSSATFYCENCCSPRVSNNTVVRIYASGREVQIDNCEDCGNRQETEFWKGPKTRIQNQDK